MFSIVIPTFNRQEWLEKALNAIMEQIDTNNVEIIILDDGSSDDTPVFLASISENYPYIKPFFHQGLGPAKLRNLGVNISHGQVLCFLDDDSILEAGWFDALRKTADELTYPYAAIKGFVKPYQDLPLPLFLGEHIHVSNSWASNNIAFFREPFLKAGGFDTQFTFAAWEDLDLGYRLERMGYRRFYEPKMIIRHPHEEDINKLIRKFRINGYGFYQFCRKWIHIDRKWIIRMWLERVRVLYYMLPGMEHLDYLRYIHGLRIKYEIYGLLAGIITGGKFKRSTKDQTISSHVSHSDESFG